MTLNLRGQDWLEADAAQGVMQALIDAGGDARFVGGAVRDGLLNRPVKDVDIATTLRPEDVMQALEHAGIKVFPTGLKHGTVTASHLKSAYEITTLRRDVETDGRHAKVAFTKDWREDAARRDFTMNALYADVSGRVYDYFTGIEDAKAGHVRFIGNAEDRIQEDALRILRFFRFQAHYGEGGPDEDGVQACTKLRTALAKLSRERVRDELLKTLTAPDPGPVFHLMAERDVLHYVVMPDCDLTALERVVRIEQAYDRPDPLRRLVALVSNNDQGARQVLASLKLSSKDITRVRAMLGQGPMPQVEMGEKEARTSLYYLGEIGFIDRLVLNADERDDLTPLIRFAMHWKTPHMPVSGHDVLKLGLAEGPEVGAVLKRLETAWVESDFTLNRDALLALVMPS